MINRKSNISKPINKAMWFRGFYLILIISSLLSCSSTRHQNLSNLTIEDKNYNRLIENRKPDYGIDGEDGCEVLGEISININELEPGFINGKIFDSERSDPIINGEVNLIISNNNATNTLKVYSDQNGNFKKEFDGDLQEIEVKYIAFRNLKVNL